MKMIIIVTSMLLTFSTLLQAKEKQTPYESYQGCGEYWIAGVVRSTKEGYFVVVNEKSQSEYNFKSAIAEEPKLAPYVDRPMKAIVMLQKRLNGTRGEISNIKAVKDRIPNPLHPVLDTGFRLIKKSECKK